MPQKIPKKQTTNTQSLAQALENQLSTPQLNPTSFKDQRTSTIAQQKRQALADQYTTQFQSAQPIQRMINIDETLYYSPNAIKGQLPGKKDKDTELGEWANNLAAMEPGLHPTAVENAYAIPGINRGVAPVLDQKLSSGINIFNYYSVGDMNGFMRNLARGEDIRSMLHPKDMLDEDPDLSADYDQGKACVLQALINLGYHLPEVEDSAEAWHRYYFSQGIMYDEDPEVYKIYTSFGLRLVSTTTQKWSQISKRLVPTGNYIFTTPGHNFAVQASDASEAAKRYTPLDRPQNIVSAYQPDRIIQYIWMAG